MWKHVVKWIWVAQDRSYKSSLRELKQRPKCRQNMETDGENWSHPISVHTEISVHTSYTFAVLLHSFIHSFNLYLMYMNVCVNTGKWAKKLTDTYKTHYVYVFWCPCPSVQAVEPSVTAYVLMANSFSAQLWFAVAVLAEIPSSSSKQDCLTPGRTFEVFCVDIFIFSALAGVTVA